MKINNKTKKSLEAFGIIYFSFNFEKWFLPLPFNENDTFVKLDGKPLPRPMNDKEIANELKPTDVSLEEIAVTLKGLQRNAVAIFYCKDISGVLRAVGVGWDDVGWRAGAGALDVNGWVGGDQVFSRNSCPPDSSSSDSLNRLPLAPLFRIATALERIADCLEKKKWT